MREYYARRAPDYDDWYRGDGRYAKQVRPGWHEEVAAVVAALTRLPPARTLDLACGTGYLSRHLRGAVTLFDASAEMLAIASSRVPGAPRVRGDGLMLPFRDSAFERLISGHFYGHLRGEQRTRFHRETRRVAAEIVIVDAAIRAGVREEEMQSRPLKDGSRWPVYKRYFRPDQLCREIDGHRVLHAGCYFVVCAT